MTADMSINKRFVRTILSRLILLTPLTLSGCIGLFGVDDLAEDNCAIGPAVPVVPQDIPSKTTASHVKVYMLHGLVDFYSLGLDELADKMRALNLEPVLVKWTEWPAYADEIVQSYTADNSMEFILIGHSYGSDDAVNLARALNDNNVPVKLLFLLDASAPPPISPNVDKCIHYYIPTIVGDVLPDIFAGNPVTLEDGNSKTVLENDMFTSDVFGSGVGCANHFSIDVNILAHNLIIDEVLKVVETGAP
jgi:hypothetical protein